MPRAQITVVKATVGIKEKTYRGAALIGRVKSKLHPGLAVSKNGLTAAVLCRHLRIKNRISRIIGSCNINIRLTQNVLTQK